MFKEEQEALLAELRTFVTSNAHIDDNKVSFFENKVKAQVKLLFIYKVLKLIMIF